MPKSLYLICFFLIVRLAASAQSYGLAFNSHETVAEKRTSLELAPGDSLCLEDKVQLDFDMNFIPNYQVYFGYILRIVNGTQNVDLIYDQRALLFRLTAGQNFSGLTFKLDSAHLFRLWNRLSFIIDRQKGKLMLSVNNKYIGSAAISLPGNCYRFLWGANDDQRFQTRDIPPMRLKDIKLFNSGNLQYHWALNESDGNTGIDEVHKQKAIVKNAVWIKPRHQKWDLMTTLVLKGNAITAFDKKHETVIISGLDSVVTYNLQHLQSPLNAIAVRHENVLNGSQAIYDSITGKLYNVLIDKKKVASYHIGDPQWDTSADSTLTEYWHANKFISSFDSCLYVIGGYGQLKYKNLVQRYNIQTRQWDVLTAKGDSFPPRYLSALGTNERGDTAFILGGYGSATGNQMLDPGNYYDFFAFDVKTATFKKLFDLNRVHTKFAFANSLVIDAKERQYYGLVFANDSFNSKLQLIKGSLDNPGYQLLGTAIPYSFYDLQSFADLYYSPDAGKLIAVTMYYSKMEAKQKFTIVKIYSIDFPPGAVDPLPTAGETFKVTDYVLPVLVLLALAGGALLVLKLKASIKQKHNSPASPAHYALTQDEQPLLQTTLIPIEQDVQSVQPAAPMVEEDAPAPSKILLFGQFQVIDKDGADISDLFTPVIRELFLLIVIYTFRNDRGITSDELNEILWTGKSVKDAKNNRSVNMAKLKNILERVGNCVLAKKSGFWQFQVADRAVYLDYEQYALLVKEKNGVDKAYMEKLLKIAGNGSFLFQTEFDWLDDIKAEISNTIIAICLKYINGQPGCTEDPEFLIEIANCIFHFDRLNEDALECKCKSLIMLKRHTLANKAYARFVKDYKDIYGDEFNKSFNQVIKTDAAGTLPV